ncbi:helix-turn-helix domain-containing protein [Neobacillus sp. D3-1R]|uniref:helix-turn-helix domain-containing protein n=1 Tax=Neobacillus sp. D3-1R TaxID=3445778 RepID=UPI003F9ECD5F
MLGERIRKLRKQKKMTLEALAGEELTKGMLSLIENNKAKPSMESLSYIAEQLEVEVSDLLDVISSQELRGILEEAEKIYNNEDIKDQDKYKQLMELVEPHVSHLTQGYEAARLLEIYSYSLYYQKIHRWQEPSDRAANMYDQLNLTSKRVQIGIFRAKIRFTHHDYSEALDIFLKERHDIELKHAYIDPLTRLDLDYHEAVYFFAVGDSDAATQVMERAIQFSKEKRIFYLINDLYRLAAAHSRLCQDGNKKENYYNKLKQYGEFAEHLPSILFCKLMDIMDLMEDRQYTVALEEINLLLSETDPVELLGPWISLEQGKVFYHLGRYEEALDSLNSVVPPPLYHPFDLSLIYVLDVYKALVHMELGNVSEAVDYAKKAVQNYKPLPDTSFKEFSLKTYTKVLQVAKS